MITYRKFPFDTQRCFLVVESYSFNSENVRLQWYPVKPVTIMSEGEFMDLPDFRLLGFRLNQARSNYPNGHWDKLVVTFTFQRRYGFFILQAYIPTLMTIMVAWISFWMDPKQISARATLGISSFLAMILQFGNILKNQPRVSYIKGMDIWMLSGILFMFGTLAELAIISYMQRGQIPVEDELGEEENSIMPSFPSFSRTTGSRLATINENEGSISRRHSGKSRSSSVATTVPSLSRPGKVDAFSRKAFPALFLMFNIVYWVYYLVVW